MRHILRRRHLKLVIVTMGDASTFRGVLFDHDPDALVLRNAEQLRVDAQPTTLIDGELILQRADVAFIQRP